MFATYKTVVNNKAEALIDSNGCILTRLMGEKTCNDVKDCEFVEWKQTWSTAWFTANTQHTHTKTYDTHKFMLTDVQTRWDVNSAAFYTKRMWKFQCPLVASPGTTVVFQTYLLLTSLRTPLNIIDAQERLGASGCHGWRVLDNSLVPDSKPLWGKTTAWSWHRSHRQRSISSVMFMFGMRATCFEVSGWHHSPRWGLEEEVNSSLGRPADAQNKGARKTEGERQIKNEMLGIIGGH